MSFSEITGRCYQNVSNKHPERLSYLQLCALHVDRTNSRGKLLAKAKTVSLSALLRLLINGAYEQFPGNRLCTVFPGSVHESGKHKGEI